MTNADTCFAFSNILSNNMLPKSGRISPSPSRFNIPDLDIPEISIAECSEQTSQKCSTSIPISNHDTSLSSWPLITLGASPGSDLGPSSFAIPERTLTEYMNSDNTQQSFRSWLKTQPTSLGQSSAIKEFASLVATVWDVKLIIENDIWLTYGALFASECVRCESPSIQDGRLDDTDPTTPRHKQLDQHSCTGICAPKEYARRRVVAFDLLFVRKAIDVTGRGVVDYICSSPALLAFIHWDHAHNTQPCNMPDHSRTSICCGRACTAIKFFRTYIVPVFGIDHLPFIYLSILEWFYISQVVPRPTSSDPTCIETIASGDLVQFARW